MMAASSASWFSLILESRDGSRSKLGIGNSPFRGQRSRGNVVIHTENSAGRQNAGGGT